MKGDINYMQRKLKETPMPGVSTEDIAVFGDIVYVFIVELEALS